MFILEDIIFNLSHILTFVRLTFVVVPHSDLRKFTQTEHVRKSKHVLGFSLKFVPVAALFQGQRPGVTKLPEHDQKHVGVSTGT